LVRDSEFKGSARLKKLLVYLCDRAEKTPESPVSQVEIAKDVMGLNDDFDPVADAHVRIEIGRLRTALALYYAKSTPEVKARLNVPKGSYIPVLESITQNKAPAFSALAGAAEILVITGLDVGFGARAELIDMVGSGTRLHCHNSPLSSTKIMKFLVETDISRDQLFKLAKQRKAPVCVHANFVKTERDTRVFVEVRETHSGDTLWCHRYALEHEGNTEPELARQISRSIGTLLSDPILGIVPGLVQSITKGEALAAVLHAYSFMASQKLGSVAEAVGGLEALSKSGASAPAVMGLLAEMRRVAGRLHVSGEKGLPEHYLEMAEEALSLDVNDITCRMALGFAKLNAGQTKSALEIGLGILELSPPLSLMHKAQMLVALADTEEKYGSAFAAKNAPGVSNFYMQEFAQIIPQIRAGNLDLADQNLSKSLYGNVFWLHVFQAAVCADAGDIKRATYSGSRIKKLVPGMEHLIVPLVGAFFPQENESQYILSGLRKSGIDVNS
jgi:hypothetical protein